MNDWLQRHVRVLVVVLLWALSLGGVAVIARRPAPVAVEIVPPPTATATPAPTATFTPAPLRVYVSGSVLHPDVYTLSPDAIVRDAITAAGGFASDANRDAINLATSLFDGSQVHIPRQEEAAAAPPAGIISPAPTPAPRAPATAPDTSPRAAPAGKVNINTASLAELDTLPGVGPVTAQRIVDGRPYAQIEDIKRVRGIGDATFEKLQPLITTQ